MTGSPALVVYGPLFMGMVFNILLYGVMTTQMYMYFMKYQRDPLWMKVLISIIFFVDSVNTGFDIALVYNPLVVKYGDTHALDFADWLSSIDPATTGLIALLTQLFYAWRVKVLTKNWYIVAIIIALSVGQFCGALGTAISVKFVPAFADFKKFESIVIVWLTCSAVADTLITSTLVWHLRKHKSGFSSTDDIVNRIIRLTVQTGMITTVCAILVLIVFLAVPTGLHLAFNLILAKLYSNSLMSTLNARTGWGFSSTSDEAAHSAHSRVAVINDPVRRVQPNVLSEFTVSDRQVFVDVETFEMRDVDSDSGKLENEHRDEESLTVHREVYKRTMSDMA